MLHRTIARDDLLPLIDELARTRRLIGPVRRDVPRCDPPYRYFYQEVRHAARLDLDFTYCVYGPRALLFPPVETLFEFRRDRKGFQTRVVYDERPTALVGVHPCDIHAIRTLDAAFSQDHPDEHYLRRRANTLIVGVDCPQPCTAGVFCKDMGTHAADAGFDVMLYPLPHPAHRPSPTTSPRASHADADASRPTTREGAAIRYGVVFGTDRGREWLAASPRCAAPTPADRQAFEAYVRAKDSAFDFALTTRAQDLPALLARSYDSLLWEATARRCYSCGSCNLSCPTCYCFDVADELDLDLVCGRRRRQWDGCQLPAFALVAGGHNFRPQAAARLRHRIYRKAVWIRERTGMPGCVGCARCDRACTARISSVEIYNQLAEEV